MPWWKKVAIPPSMKVPDLRTERVIDRLEVVAGRMEAVAKILSDDLDCADAEQRDLQRIVRDAQGGRASRRSADPDRSDDVEDRTSDGGGID